MAVTRENTGNKSGTTFTEKQGQMDEAANKRASEEREGPAERKRQNSRRDHSEKRRG